LGLFLCLINAAPNTIPTTQDTKTPSELTEGEVDTPLHFSVTKKLGSSVPKPWELLEALGPHGISDTGAS